MAAGALVTGALLIIGAAGGRFATVEAGWMTGLGPAALIAGTSGMFLASGASTLTVAGELQGARWGSYRSYLEKVSRGRASLLHKRHSRPPSRSPQRAVSPRALRNGIGMEGCRLDVPGLCRSQVIAAAVRSSWPLLPLPTRGRRPAAALRAAEAVVVAPADTQITGRNGPVRDPARPDHARCASALSPRESGPRSPATRRCLHLHRPRTLHLLPGLERVRQSPPETWSEALVPSTRPAASSGTACNSES